MQENPTPWDKEAIYDTELNPLVAKIIEICDREKLPFIISVGYKNQPETENEEEDHSYCTSYGPGPGNIPDPRLFEALKVIRRNRSMMMAAFTVVEKEVQK